MFLAALMASQIIVVACFALVWAAERAIVHWLMDGKMRKRRITATEIKARADLVTPEETAALDKFHSDQRAVLLKMRAELYKIVRDGYDDLRKS